MLVSALVGGLIRRTPLRRTRMRRIGPKGRIRMGRMAAARPALEARSRGRCELPWCKTTRRLLDPHHLKKRSQGGSDDPTQNLVYLCRADHRRTDLPVGHPRYLDIHPFQDDLGRWFACFIEGSLVQCVPLAVPEEITLTRGGGGGVG